MNSSVDETRKTLALFNKDWNTYKTNWQQGFSQNGFVGGVKSIFQSSNQNSVISKDQVQILRNWNNAVKHGCTDQATFNRIIANADKNTKMYFAGLNKGKGSIEGLKNAQNVAKQSTIGLTIAQTALNMAISMGLMAAISLAIKGFDKLINSAKRASEAADEAFSETNDKVQEYDDELKSLDELIAKYKELKESKNLDLEGRKEIKEIQNDIADLVGTQAKNLDLVNGKLDEEIEKLNKISAKEAKDAYETATANYFNSQKANKNAAGNDSYLFLDGYAYVGKKEKEPIKILQDAGFNSAVQTGGLNPFNQQVFVMDSFDNDMKELKGAQEKADYLQSMIDVLEQNGQRATDLYAGLIQQRDDYLAYIDNQQGAANSLVNSWLTYSQFSNQELSKINVDSVESFETYRQKMIDEAKKDESIGKVLADGTLSDEDLENAVNDFMATSINFSTWYEQWINNVQSSTLDDKITVPFLEAFNAEDFKETKENLLELAKAGTISPETLTSTEEYNKLLEETGLSAEEAMVKIIDMCNELDYSTLMDGLADSIGVLIDTEKEMADEGVVSFGTVQKMLELYPELEDALIATSEGYKIEKDAIESVIEAQIDNYELCVNQAIEAANKLMGAQFGVAGSYAATTEEIRNQITAQIDSLRATQGMLAGQAYTYSHDGTRAGYERSKELNSQVQSIQNQIDGMLKALGEVEDAQVNLDKYKEIIEQLRIDNDNNGSGSGSGSEDSDSYFDWIEVKLDKLNDELEKTKEQIADTFNWDVRDKALDKSITDTNILIEQQRLAMKRYMEEAEKSGLAQPYVDLIKDGKIDLLKLSNDDPLKEQIDSYQEWYEKAEQCNEAIAQLKTDLDSLYDNKRTLKWEIFDYLEEQISRITDEADYLIELLSKEDLFDDNGNLTKYADATIGLHASNYDAYMQKAADYAEEIEDLEKQLATGGQEVLDKYNERVDAHQDAILAAQQEKEAILDLVENSYQKQLDYLNEIIDKKKESLNAEKD